MNLLHTLIESVLPVREATSSPAAERGAYWRESVRGHRLHEDGATAVSPDYKEGEGSLSGADPHETDRQSTDDSPKPIDNPKFDTLIVPSKAYAALWTGELLGQVVDGAYMNRSGDHKRWDSVRMEVDLSRKTPVMNTSTASPLQGNFPFDQDVVPVVGDRMVKLVQQVDPSATLVDVTRMCNELAVALRQPREE